MQITTPCISEIIIRHFIKISKLCSFVLILACLGNSTAIATETIGARVDVKSSNINFSPGKVSGGKLEFSKKSGKSIKKYIIFRSSNLKPGWHYAEFDFTPDKDGKANLILAGEKKQSNKFNAVPVKFHDLKITGAKVYSGRIAVFPNGEVITERFRRCQRLKLIKGKTVKISFYYKEISTPASKKNDEFIDLTAEANMGFTGKSNSENKDISGELDDYLKEFSIRGISNLGGCKFKITDPKANKGKSVIVLSPLLPDKKGKTKAVINYNPPISGRRYLYLLHTCSGKRIEPGDLVGSVTVKYRGGAASYYNLQHRKDLSGGGEKSELPNGLIAWQTAPEKTGMYKALQMSKIPLDTSAEDITSIEFENKGSQTWMIVAATLSDNNIKFPEFKEMKIAEDMRDTELKCISSIAGNAWQMKLRDNFLYVAQKSRGLRIYDLRKPSDPRRVFAGKRIKGLYCYCIEIVGNYAFAAYRGGFRNDIYGRIEAYDISDPLKTKLVGSYDNYCAGRNELGFMPTTAESFSHAGRNYLAIAGNANFRNNLTGMVLIDITDPAKMFVCGKYCDREAVVTPHGLSIADDNNLVLTGNYVSPTKLQIFDTSNPRKPVRTGIAAGPIHRTWQAINYQKKYVYMSLLACGLAIFDISDIKDIKFCGVRFFPKNSLGYGALYDEPPLELMKFKHFLLASNSERGYAVINLKPDPKEPCFVGNILPQGATGIFRSLTWNNKIIVFANGDNDHPAYPNSHKIYICELPDFMK